jgi:hypothetical protein
VSFIQQQTFFKDKVAEEPDTYDENCFCEIVKYESRKKKGNKRKLEK